MQGKLPDSKHNAVIGSINCQVVTWSHNTIMPLSEPDVLYRDACQSCYSFIVRFPRGPTHRIEVQLMQLHWLYEIGLIDQYYNVV